MLNMLVNFLLSKLNGGLLGRLLTLRPSTTTRSETAVRLYKVVEMTE
jgi:hypothetical protein